MKNNTWILTDLSPGCKPVGCKWIFKKKLQTDGTVDKFKARLVTKGFFQQKGIDFFDTYSSVARISYIKILPALASTHNIFIHQMDVKTAFLNIYGPTRKIHCQGTRKQSVQACEVIVWT